MDPETPIFKPRYPAQIRLVILGLPLLFFTLLCGAANLLGRMPALFWLFVLAAGLFTSLMPFLIIREIRFVDEMVVRRYFLPDQFLAHKEIEQIDADAIRMAGRRIRFGQLENIEELREMFQRWKAARILKESRRVAPSESSLYPSRGYGMYASFWGLLFGVIMIMLEPPWLRLDPRWLMAGTFLLVYFAYIYIVPKRL